VEDKEKPPLMEVFFINHYFNLKYPFFGVHEGLICKKYYLYKEIAVGK